MSLNKRDLIRQLNDERCPPLAEVKVRVVDHAREDGPYGSYYAEEFSLALGFTGWADGHWSFLAYGRISDTDKLILKLREQGNFSFTYAPELGLHPWRVAFMDGTDLHTFDGVTFTDALRSATDWLFRKSLANPCNDEESAD